MTMFAKFDGRCKACGGFIPKGSPIVWNPGLGARHAGVCPSKVAPVAVAQAAPVVAPEPVVVAVAGIVALLEGAKARGLVAPKARFLAPNGGELRLSLAAGATRYPGSVQVKIDGEWIGRIEVTGALTHGLLNRAGMVDTLKAIANNPAAAAKAYGALMGKCSFCGKPLTDAGSVEVGYGPICADKFDLPHTPKGTPKLSAVVAVEEAA